MKRVAVIGLGKMGLPIAAYISTHGASVVGVDIDPTVVGSINRGIATVSGESGLDEAVASAVASGTLSATSDPAAIADCEVVIVLIPLLAIDGEPDFDVLDQGVASIAEHIAPETLVVFETTLPVGTTRNRFAPTIRASQPSTLVAFSPERVFSGRVFTDLETYPKIVGGVDAASTETAVSFYESILSAEVWPVASSEEAEMVKLAETTYRDLNIAYANELARICDHLGLDVTDVIRGANSQPFSHIHSPGVGVGGHCIPHYPHLLLNAGVPSELVSVGRAVNDSMPEWTIERLEHEIGSMEGKVVVGLGLAYRAGVREHVSSPAFGLRDSVERRGGTYLVADPLYADAEIEDVGFSPWDGVTDPDAFILVTPHGEFAVSMLSPFRGATLLDGRNAWSAEAVEAVGLRYVGFGR